MKKNMQLLRAMSEIRPQYIEDAGERTAKTGGITMRWRIAGGAAIAACFAVSAAVLMPGVQNALRESAASAESPAVQTEETTAALMRTAEENETTAAAETALTETDYAAPALTLTTAETALLAENPVTEALTVQTAAAVQTEAPAVTTLAETSAPRTTSETVNDPAKDEAFYEENKEKLAPMYEEIENLITPVEENVEYHLLALPRKLLDKSYDEGYEAHTREQYDYLCAQLGDVSYRIDDCYTTCDSFLSKMCALDYITEEEMFAYGDLVAYEGGRLPDEIIAISENSEFLRRCGELGNEIWKAGRKSDAWYRMLNYDLAFGQTHGQADDKGELVNQPNPVADDYIYAVVFCW